MLTTSCAPSYLIRLLFVLVILPIAPVSLFATNLTLGVPVASAYLASPSVSSLSQTPLLLTQNNSTRALALEAITLRTEPFRISQLINFGAESRTRLLLFATDIDVATAENLSAFSADAEDANHQVYPLQVEYVDRVPVSEIMYAIHVRLNDQMTENGDVLVRLYCNGLPSNRVRVGLGSVGGGLPDDGGPEILDVSPSSVMVGASDSILSVMGSNFTAGSRLFLNGIEHSATVASDNLLSSPLTSSDVALAGNYAVRVESSAGVSNSVSFAVNNPQPAIINLSPSSVIKGGSGFILTVSGTGFVQGSVVNFNGSSRVTTFLSATLLTAQILASDLAVAGSFPVKVVNATPGGGASAAASFVITQPVPTPSPLPSPTSTPSPTPTPSPLPSPTSTPSPTPTPSPLPSPTSTPSPTPTPTPSPTPTPPPTPSPTPSPTPIVGSQFYVAPTGAPTGDGSLQRPWDLPTALAHPTRVRPGDTIWMRGGTYRGTFTSNLTGTAQAPIIVRVTPGERAIIDQNIGESHNRKMTINGAYAWYWGLEVTDSHPVRSTQVSGSDPPDVPREGSAIYIYGHHVKIINPIIHDLGDGIGFWVQSLDSEVYGAIIYNNGWSGPDRGHGHGLYTQNQDGTKKITDTISFNNFATGMKAFGEQGYSIGYHFDGIVSFNNGSPTAIFINQPSYRMTNLLVGSSIQPSDRIKITDSHFYSPPSTDVSSITLGYTARNSGNVEIRNNYLMGGSNALGLAEWRSAVITGNTAYIRNSVSTSHRLVTIKPATGYTLSNFIINSNTYYDESPGSGGIFYPFSFTGFTNQYGYPSLTFDNWRQQGSFDSSSVYTRGRPTGSKVIIRPNRYESGRANIIVYNWNTSNSIVVNLNNLGLSNGDTFEIRDVQNLSGAPVFTGTYNGAPITLSLSNRTVTAPIGMSTAPTHTGPEFFVFLLTRR